jgi:hypothetical protein
MAEERTQAVEEITVEINADALLDLSFEDWEAIFNVGDGQMSAQMIDVLDRVVVGGVRKRKWRNAPGVIRAFFQALNETANPTDRVTGKNSEGG